MTDSNHEDLPAATQAAVREFRRDELAALAGGLTLIPVNLHHLARLEWLAWLAVTTPSCGRRSVSRTSARKLLNEILATSVGSADDPCETLATEAFTYNVGTHIFVAPDPDFLFALRTLASLIAHSDQLPAPFRHVATGLIQGVCALSDLVVSRMRLARNTRVPEAGPHVSVPPEPDLKAILAAVYVKSAELNALMERTMLRRIDLESLSVVPGGISVSSLHPPSEQLGATPLLRLKDNFIVIAPHRLAEALVHRLIQIAAEMGVHTCLAENFHRRIFLNAQDNLERLGLRLTSRALASLCNLKDTIATHAIYQCDRDKVLHVAIFSDALHAEGAGIATHWPTDEIEEELRAARNRIPNLLAQTTPPIAEWITLVLLGGIGRNYAYSHPGAMSGEPDLIFFRSEELETIVLSKEGPGCSALLLWKYAQALHELKSRAEVLSFSSLDTYASWQEHRYAFPADIDLVVVHSTFGRILREHAIERYDWHAIPARTPTHTIEVMLADGPEQPIYTPRGARANRIEIAVERPGLVMWVVSSHDLAEPCEHFAIWLDVGRMIAYWLSEFSGHLVSEFANLGAICNVIVIEFDLVEANPPHPVQHDYQITQLSHQAIHVIFHPSFKDKYDDTNAFERQFAGDLIQAVLGLTNMDAASAAAAVSQQLDIVAPLGVKRMMHMMNTHQSPEFIGASQLARPRYPHSADLVRVQRKMLSDSPLSGTDITGNDAVTWLNKTVGIIYKESHDQLSRLDARDILDRLLLNNESLIYDDAHRDITLSSRLACYHSSETIYKRLLDEEPRHASASMVTRFLIEHIAAEPPTGTRPVSDFELDMLFAQGLKIVILGIASDIAYFELADVHIRMKDGEVVIDGGTYDEAARGTFLANTREQLNREQSRQRVIRSRRQTENDEPSELMRKLEVACRDEFGVELSVIAKILQEAAIISEERSTPVVAISRAHFVQHIAERLSLEDQTVILALDSLTLSPRVAYTKPPKGFEVSDIWPWRFNRGLSYIRRPFVLTSSGSDDAFLHFTPGHVHRASMNLISLITTGRLKARSKSLAGIMGEFTKEASDAFNEEVAQERRARGFMVRTQAAKFGKARIADINGNALGDIDVLCMDPGQRRILAIECKDFQMARVPHEVRADLEALFISTKGKRCAQEKHIRRVDWLKEHIDLVVSTMGGDITGGGWRVDGAFVFSAALISPLLGHAKLPIWTLQDLRNGVAI